MQTQQHFKRAAHHTIVFPTQATNERSKLSSFKVTNINVPNIRPPAKKTKPDGRDAAAK
jgi:hypothetical protein